MKSYRYDVYSLRWVWFLTALHVLGLLAIGILWDSLPASIPIHWDSSGSVDAYGPRSAIVAFPLLGIAVVAYLSVMKRSIRRSGTAEAVRSGRSLVPESVGVLLAGMLLLVLASALDTSGSKPNVGAAFVAVVLIGAALIVSGLSLRRVEEKDGADVRQFGAGVQAVFNLRRSSWALVSLAIVLLVLSIGFGESGSFSMMYGSALLLYVGIIFACTLPPSLRGRKQILD